jgi:hypothetical protein
MFKTEIYFLQAEALFSILSLTFSDFDHKFGQLDFIIKFNFRKGISRTEKMIRNTHDGTKNKE